ncbi:hypothetical protein [Streptomyces sp. enrichment culture]|uniref:hypothetical protein n=1 Tax=Streptomyces sp. enrichment culture TaxID=1795815 RepID=UPI003F55F749
MHVENRRRRTHASLWRALAVPAAAVIAVPVLATDAGASHLRTVTGSVAFRIMDYESVGRNEVCHRNVSLDHRDIEIGVDNTRPITVRARCGGEIRIEVHYDIRHDSGGFIRVTNGLVELYEGTTTRTGDKDGWTEFERMFLYPLQRDSRNIHVQNTEEEQPHDKADVTLTLRNSHSSS